MAQSNTAPPPEARRSESETEAVQLTTEYYFSILPGRRVYHIAHDGTTLCGIPLHEKQRWYKRGSERLIPPEVRLCQDCDSRFHRELALSKAHIREELASLAGIDRTGPGPFSKEELANLLAVLRERSNV